MIDKGIQVLGTDLVFPEALVSNHFQRRNMLPAVIIVLMLLVLAIALEKEVMRKVRKSRFQKTLAEDALPNFKSGGD